MLVNGKYFATKKEFQVQMRFLLQTSSVSQPLGEKDAGLVIAMWQRHSDFAQQNVSVEKVTAEFVKSSKVKHFVIHTVTEQIILNISECINGRFYQSKIKKMLCLQAKPFVDGLLTEFQNSDRICNRTWKPIPVGMETVVFKNNESIADLALSFQKQLSKQEKQQCLYKWPLPDIITKKWEAFLKMHQPIVVSQ